MELKVMRCPGCCANITFAPGARTAKCEYCDTVVYADGDFKPEAAPKASAKAYSKPEPRTVPQGNSGRINAAPDSEALDKWKKKSRIWVIGLGVLLALGVATDPSGFSDAVGSVFFAWLVFGGVYMLMCKPRRARTAPSAGGQNSEELPWPLRTGWIIAAGFFSGGIYWIAGPVLRLMWRNNHAE